LNPVWWFLNDDEPDPPDWQLPGKPFVIRQLSWYLRNPLHNFGKYVLGVTDRNYTVVGAAPVYATTWSDVDPAKTGWKVSTIYIDELRHPFVSYENDLCARNVGRGARGKLRGNGGPERRFQLEGTSFRRS
jgi:hypothetical protein